MPVKVAHLALIATLVLAARPVAAQQTTIPNTPHTATRAAAGPRDSGAVRMLPVTPGSLIGRLRLEPTLRRRSRAGHAVIGGLIGGVTGIMVCTAISNYVNEGTGFSTCTTSGNTAFILGGATLGAAIGALVK